MFRDRRCYWEWTISVVNERWHIFIPGQTVRSVHGKEFDLGYHFRRARITFDCLLYCYFVLVLWIETWGRLGTSKGDRLFYSLKAFWKRSWSDEIIWEAPVSLFTWEFSTPSVFGWWMRETWYSPHNLRRCGRKRLYVTLSLAACVKEDLFQRNNAVLSYICVDT